MDMGRCGGKKEKIRKDNMKNVDEEEKEKEEKTRGAERRRYRFNKCR
jgi:hypothetical protein